MIIFIFFFRVRRLEESKQRLADDYEKQCSTYAAAKADAEAQQSSRRQQVRQVVELAASNGMPAGDPGKFISATWLQSWADAPASTPPPPIDNAPLLCTHGKLDPTRPNVMRRIPTHAWAELATTCRGGPELQPRDACTICLGELLAAVAQKEDSNEARDRFLAIATALGEEGNSEEGDVRPAGVGEPAYYVSKPWLSAWRNRGGRSMSTTPPTAAIECPHGGLAPETLTKISKRIALPADFWAFLQRSWMFSEADRAKKARIKEAEKARKAQGGAAVLGGGAQGGASPGEKKENGGDDEDDVVEIVDMEIEGAQHAQQGSGFGGGGGPAVSLSEHKQPASSDDIEEVLETENEDGEDGGGASGSGNNKKRRMNGAINGDATTMNTDNNNNNNTDGSSSVLYTSTPLPEFPVDQEECPVCCAQMEEAARLSRGLQSRLAAEKSTLSHLLTPGLVQLTPGDTYRLIPRSFMDHWRAYMSQAGGGRRGGGGGTNVGTAGVTLLATNPKDILEAPKLGDYMSRAACECHRTPPYGPLLAFQPPQVVNRRGRWVLASSDAPVGSIAAVTAAEDPNAFFELLSPNDWSGLMEHYIEDELPFGVEGISATLRVENKQMRQSPAPETTGAGAGVNTVAGGAGGAGAAAVTTISGGKAGSDMVLDSSDKELDPAAHDQPVRRHVGDEKPPSASRNEQLLDGVAWKEEENKNGRSKSPGELAVSIARAQAREGEKKEEAEGFVTGIEVNEPSLLFSSQQGIDAIMDVDHQEIFGQDPDNLYDKRPTGNLRPSTACIAWLHPIPSVCTTTLAVRETALKAARLSYMNAEIMVETSPTDDEAIAATLAAAAAAAGAGVSGIVPGVENTGERKSKRARKGRAPITVDCTSTLNDLRLRIYQSLGVHPRNARLFVRGQMIENPDDITLSECEIYPNEEIRVVDTGEHDPDDLTGLFGSPTAGRKNGASGREGFGGTALTGLHFVQGQSVQGGGSDGDDDVDMTGFIEHE